MADRQNHSKGSARGADPDRTLASKLRLAGLALSWERIWPRLALPLTVLAIFLALAWLGLFAALGDWVRLGLGAVFVVVFLAALVPLARIRVPGRAEAVGRLERDSAFEHHPLIALSDRRAGNDPDPLAEAMWQAHQRRAAAALSALRVRAPSPRLDRLDPYALRAGVFLLFAIGLVAGRGDYAGPVAGVFRLPVTPGPEIRIDAWVTPPAYTGRAPIFLTDAEPATAADVDPDAEPRVLAVPAGSVFSMRVNGVEAPAARFLPADGAEAQALDGSTPTTAATRDPATDRLIRPAAYELRLERGGAVVLADESGDLRQFAFTVDPDLAPTIRVTEDPAATSRGAFRLAYSVEDDYRVAGARAVFEAPKTPLDEAVAGGETARPLIGAPEMPLSLPRRNAGSNAAESYRDLSAHPWAGAVVAMQLEARDDAGNVGRSEPLEVVIPARPFRDPVARMLIEQRRMLALDANRAPAVVDTFDTIAFYAPEFIDDLSVHLGLRVVRNRVANARGDEDLRDALDLMWEMALAIDGGDASLAEQRLREARERLREALENGASAEEIARLTEELRQAMQEYMQALAEQMRNNPDLAQPMSPQQQQNAQEITPQDFQEMIDRIEELSKLGDREAAEQLLSQLDRMLENLQMAQPQQRRQNQSGEQSPQQQMMNELADMIRRQQELMNETHKLTPDGRPQQGQPGEMTEEQRQQRLQDLQQQQQALQQQLQEMMEQMQQQGMQPGDQLGEAQQQMEGAEGSLGEGQSEQALGQQGQALQAMREGARQMAEQMARQQGEGEGQGQQAGQNNYGEDPLGRPQRRKGPDFGDSVKVPGEIEVQRARRILEELRRRFSEPGRPSIELDYLQRLLNPF